MLSARVDLATGWRRARQKVVRSSELRARLSEEASRTVHSSGFSLARVDLESVLGVGSCTLLQCFEVQTSFKASLTWDDGNLNPDSLYYGNLKGSRRLV